MTTSDSWGPGYVIAERYSLVSLLGRGGMGSVWRAEHLSLRSAIAVKLIDTSIVSNEEALSRFMREAQATAALRSPHVVQTFDYGVHEGVPFIAMELLDGESLADRLTRVGRLTPEVAANTLTQVARAIGRAHELGIVHRDLKPDNIFLVRNDDDEIAKVLDFGIAKSTGSSLEASSQTRTGALLGTPYYMSPEQAEGNRNVDHRSDLWSLAVIAFECITGRRPFESESLGELILMICARPIVKPSSIAVVPPSFDDWFAHATERDPSRRFQSAKDLAEQLRAVAGLEPRGVFRTGEGPGLGSKLPDQKAVTGGAVARTASNFSTRREPSRNVVLGATLSALTLAAVVVYLVARSGGPQKPSTEPPSRSASAPMMPAAPTTSMAIPTAVPKAPPAVVTNAPSGSAPPPSATPQPTAPPAAPTAHRPSTHAVPKAPLQKAPTATVPPHPPKVDFGF